MLGAEIGRGGTAIVRSAVQPRLGREVAVKTLKPELRRLGRVLVQEARVVASLPHPGIIPVHDLVVDADGAPSMVMARVDGTSWLRCLSDNNALIAVAGPTPDAAAFHLDVLVRVCRVLEFAHDRGVVHRDVKPENVMLGVFGQVYLVDWGIAVRTGDGDAWIPAANASRQPAGTPAYMAPELLGDGDVGPWTDVFLLGATLYHVLAGRPPYERGLPEIFDEIRACAPPPPPGDLDLVALARSAMAHDPAARPLVRGFREAIERHQQARHAANLAANAAPLLARLEALVGRPDASPADIHRLYGEVSFGFRQALGSHPLATARDGLSRAGVAMAGWALDRDDLAAADVYLAALPEVPDALARRREALADRQAREARRAAAARRDGDTAIGRGARAALLFSFAVSWVVFPFTAWPLVTPEQLGHVYNFGSSIVLTAVSAGVLAAVKHSHWNTAFNRSIAGTLVVLFCSQLLLDSGGALLGLAPEVVHTLRLPLWAAVSAMVGVTLERALLATAAAYAVAFCVAAAWPALLLPAIGMGNLMFAAVAVTLVVGRR